MAVIAGGTKRPRPIVARVPIRPACATEGDLFKATVPRPEYSKNLDCHVFCHDMWEMHSPRQGIKFQLLFHTGSIIEDELDATDAVPLSLGSGDLANARLLSEIECDGRPLAFTFRCPVCPGIAVISFLATEIAIENTARCARPNSVGGTTNRRVARKGAGATLFRITKRAASCLHLPEDNARNMPGASVVE